MLHVGCHTGESEAIRRYLLPDLAVFICCISNREFQNYRFLKKQTTS